MFQIVVKSQLESVKVESLFIWYVVLPEPPMDVVLPEVSVSQKQLLHVPNILKPAKPPTLEVPETDPVL
jgi:hypothetical protein